MELKDVKGIGSKSLALLNKLNIETVLDLLTYYPVRYDILKKTDFNELDSDMKVIVDGRVIVEIFALPLNPSSAIVVTGKPFTTAGIATLAEMFSPADTLHDFWSALRVYTKPGVVVVSCVPGVLLSYLLNRAEILKLLAIFTPLHIIIT